MEAAGAAAAKAGKEFARQASERSPPETLNDREWGAYLYRNRDGSIRIGPINYGARFSAGGVGSVSLIEDGNPADIIGFVHSHAGGNHLPSDGPNDEDPGDIQVLDRIIAYSANPAVRMYIVAENHLPSGRYNQINFYNRSNARSSRDHFENGPEVNPEAKSCAGD